MNLAAITRFIVFCGGPKTVCGPYCNGLQALLWRYQGPTDGWWWTRAGAVRRLDVPKTPDLI
jgi:hypothetical protein